MLLILAFYSATNSSHLAHDPLLELGDWPAYAFCHRITERSFTINGRQFPLCARCTGMYLGVALAAIVFMLSGRMRRAYLPPKKIFIVLMCFIILMGIDGINSYSHFFPGAPHLYQPQNWLRLTTGMGTGLAMGLIIFPTLAQTLWRSPTNLPVIGSWRELFELLILAIMIILLLLSNQPTLMYVLSLASVGGLLAIITILNTIILLVIVRKDASFSSWHQALFPLLTGFILAAVEIGVISYLRFTLTGTMTGIPGL